jgi:hypothetical protein
MNQMTHPLATLVQIQHFVINGLLICLVRYVKRNSIAEIPALGTLARMDPKYVLKSTCSTVDLSIPVKVLIRTFTTSKEL